MMPFECNVPFKPFFQSGIEFEGIHQNPLQGTDAIQILFGTSNRTPTKQSLLSAWKTWTKGRAISLVVFVRHGQNASILGPYEHSEPLFDLDYSKTRNFLHSALKNTSSVLSKRFIDEISSEIRSETFGLVNRGFLATRELTYGLKKHKDWRSMCASAKTCVEKRNRDLVRALGFSIDDSNRSHRILRFAGVSQAIGIFLEEDEAPETSSGRFGKKTPASYGFEYAEKENLPWLIVTTNSGIRLYPVGG
ncbi:MAG: hypothetical protein FWH47_02765, partial [Methanomassiliicoccaceae archaeon]|nr:hypothetical protein [Methanomassiliicoccaceae archaeon]